MSATFTNRFILCTNTDSSEVTLEFFVEEPVFDSGASKIQSATTTSVSKLIMSKNCAESLRSVLSDVLDGKKNQGN